ncbi:MAG: carboxyl transferase domain-containing protein, partial [Microbacterium sp.]
MTDQPDLFTTAGKIADLRSRFQEAVVDAEKAAQHKQHAKNKLTARQRIEMLVDTGSFVEFDEYVRHRTTAFGMERSRPYGDSVVTGVGTIHGRTVAVYSQDFSTFGGSLGEVAGEKIIKVMEFALRGGMPCIGI